MKLIKIILSSIILFNIISCATVKVHYPTMKELCNGFVGKHYTLVVDQWGNYNCEKSNENGGRILTWVDRSDPAYFTNFSVNSEGIIYNWQSNQKTKTDLLIKETRIRNIKKVLKVSTVVIVLIGLLAYNINNGDYGGSINTGEWF